MGHEAQFYIGGQWVDPIEPGDSITVINPATEEQVARVAAASAADVEAAVHAAFGLSGYVKFGPRGTSPQGGAPHANWYCACSNGAPTDRHAPFGGYKKSGNGREWGRFGLEHYLETKAIMGYERR